MKIVTFNRAADPEPQPIDVNADMVASVEVYERNPNKSVLNIFGRTIVVLSKREDVLKALGWPCRKPKQEEAPADEKKAGGPPSDL